MTESELLLRIEALERRLAKRPTIRWDARMVYGYILLGVIGGIILAIALGRVHEESSFTLRELETGLLMLASGWSGWAFGSDRDRGKKIKTKHKPEEKTK